MPKLDAVDHRLLAMLQKDSSLTTKELAAKVNLSPTPVFERVKRLEKHGYVKKYVAVLDAEKLGSGLIVFCNITLKEHSQSIGHRFVEEIMTIDEVTECYNISGDHDFLLKVMVKDMKHYQDFVFNTLGSVSNVGSAHSTFVMAEIKNSHAVPMHVHFGNGQ
ncbi:Lrp/AsnC family transcriptional regulator [Reichenbachiella sp. ABR2-5]|uniref:Lrp/AsnC family transcriptional regulator n=1 Tax=Reichenbachiella ulvae TaxID=2980104 RepID=A0ABT3CXM3_9BACT|nr:Lrp/AsnC family transcriptional regulator [Reichenbachiella ulvae]